MTKYFLQIIIQSKTIDDWRAFLYYLDITECGMSGFDTAARYEIRGYGTNPQTALDDAWTKYNDEDVDLFSNYAPY